MPHEFQSVRRCHVKSMCSHARFEMTSEIYVIFPGSHRTTYENFVTGNFNPWECHRGLNCMETYNQWWWCKFAIAFVTNVLSLPARLMWISGFWDDIWMALDQSDPRTGVLSCGIKLAKTKQNHTNWSRTWIESEPGVTGKSPIESYDRKTTYSPYLTRGTPHVLLY